MSLLLGGMTRMDAAIEGASCEIHQLRFGILVGKQKAAAGLAEHTGEARRTAVRRQVLGALDANVRAGDHGSANGQAAGELATTRTVTVLNAHRGPQQCVADSAAVAAALDRKLRHAILLVSRTL